MDLAGRVALVTGGSAGIGLAISRRLVAAGADVVLVARGKAALDAAVAELGPKASAMQVDVLDLGAVEALPARIVAEKGRLDVVVNNAGLHRRGPVTQVAAAELGKMVIGNLASPIVLTRAALDHLPADGAIVNIASIAGYTPLQDAATYSATKVGLRFFTIALREELADRGVHACVVSPGPVDTGFLAEIDEVSPMVFSQPMSSAEDVADGVMRALDEKIVDLPIPASSGRLATLGYLVPALTRFLRPRLMARGEAAKRAYKARKGW